MINEWWNNFLNTCDALWAQYRIGTFLALVSMIFVFVKDIKLIDDFVHSDRRLSQWPRMLAYVVMRVAITAVAFNGLGWGWRSLKAIFFKALDVTEWFMTMLEGWGPKGMLLFSTIIIVMVFAVFSFVAAMEHIKPQVHEYLEARRAYKRERREARMQGLLAKQRAKYGVSDDSNVQQPGPSMSDLFEQAVGPQEYGPDDEELFDGYQDDGQYGGEYEAEQEYDGNDDPYGTAQAALAEALHEQQLAGESADPWETEAGDISDEEAAGLEYGITDPKKAVADALERLRAKRQRM